MIDREEIVRRRKEVLAELFKNNQTGRCQFLTETGECGLGKRILDIGESVFEEMSYREKPINWRLFNERVFAGKGYVDGLDIFDCRAVMTDTKVFEENITDTAYAMSGAINGETGLPPEGEVCIGPNIKLLGK